MSVLGNNIILHMKKNETSHQKAFKRVRIVAQLVKTHL